MTANVVLVAISKAGKSASIFQAQMEPIIDKNKKNAAIVQGKIISIFSLSGHCFSKQLFLPSCVKLN